MSYRNPLHGLDSNGDPERHLDTAAMRHNAERADRERQNPRYAETPGRPYRESSVEDWDNPAPPHQARRGSDVEAWIKRHRDENGDGPDFGSAWDSLNNLLDEYRLHADTGTPLDEPVQDYPGDR